MESNILKKQGYTNFSIYSDYCITLVYDDRRDEMRNMAKSDLLVLKYCASFTDYKNKIRYLGILEQKD
jgi:hypothetical protein